MAYNADALTKLNHLKELAKKTAQKADKATTLAGYGITDAYTKTEADAKYAEKATTLKGYGITDAYTKTDTDSKISEAVAAADHMKRKIVSATSEIDLTASDASQYIYMVLKSSSKTADKYDEYMVIDGVLEKVGNWEVDLSNYVQKETGKGLSTNDYTDDEKAKLADIAEGANNYTHPAYTPHASNLYKVTVDATGHVSAATAATKDDITGLGIPAQDTTYDAATASADGLMSAADKTKLDGITVATDAEVTEMLNEVFTDETSST